MKNCPFTYGNLKLIKLLIILRVDSIIYNSELKIRLYASVYEYYPKLVLARKFKNTSVVSFQGQHKTLQ